MNRSILALVLLVTITAASCTPAADRPGGDAGALEGEAGGAWVDVASGERRVRTWVTRPDVAGPAPTIIVIHQNRGMTDWVRSVADRLAQEGYIAAAPDLLSGMAPGGGDTDAFADSDAARDGIYALPPAQVTGDLDAVADYLASLPGSDGTVSVSGFCWGGSESFRFATNRPDLTAAYVFYGTGPELPVAIGRVRAPVHGFYGGDDQRVNATIEPTAGMMDAAGLTYDPVVYDGAGHGFMSRGEEAEAGDPNQAAMEAGWQRWRALLARYRG